MSSKPPTPEFKQTIPTGTLTLICGIGALALLFQNLGFACLLGTMGIILGIVTLNTHAKTLDKILARIGTLLSFVPILYAMLIWIRK